MEGQLDRIEKKLVDLELRISKLEGGVKPSPTQTPEKQKKGLPISTFIYLAIGGYLLFSSLPSLFFGYGGFLGSISFFITIIGAVLVGVGVMSIMRHKKQLGQEEETVSETVSIPPPVVSEIKSQAPPVIEPQQKAGQSFEFNIAANWFAIVGIIAIVLAVVFFLKFAFDNKLIGPVGQVSIGIFFGLCLIAAGEFLRNKYPKYSFIISGGGIVVLYLSLWAAFALFHLVAAAMVLAASLLVTIVAALLAVRYQAIAIATLGILGGFASPVLLAKGFDSQIALMAYIVSLNIGVLIIAIFQNWRKLNIPAFAATYLVFAAWYATFYGPEKLFSTEIFLTIIFLIYGLVLFVYNVVNNKMTEDLDVILMLLNAVVYFAVSYFLLESNYRDLLGFFALALALYYFLLGFISFQRFKQDSVLTLGLLGISIAFLTIAVPLQVKKNLITLIWSVEGAVLLWLGFWLQSYRLRVAALAVYLLVAGRLLFFDTIILVDTFVLIYNLRFITFLAAAASIGIAAWLYHFYRQKIQEDEKPILPVLLIACNVVLVWAISWESISYFGQKIENVRKSAIEKSQQEQRYVLGTSTISRSIKQVSDAISVGCPNISQKNILFGTDYGCQPPQKVTTGLRFENITVPKNAKITSAYLQINKLSYSSPDAVTTNPITLKISREDRINPESFSSDHLPNLASKSATVVNWTINFQYGSNQQIFQLPSVLNLVEEAINNLDWQSGSAISFIIETTSATDTFYAYGFEISQAKSPKLYINYTTDSTSPNIIVPSPYNPNQYNPPDVYTPSQPRNYYPTVQLDAKTREEIKNLESARDVSLSIIWILYSITMIIIGIVKKYQPIRLSAIVFFGISILKVFLFDSRSLQLGYRIVAFMVLGTILLSVSLIYQKYKHKIETFLLKDETP